MPSQNNPDLDSESAKEGSLADQPFVSHLIELRDRLLRVVLVMLVLFVAAMFFYDTIYTFFSTVIKEITGAKLTVIDPLSPVMLMIKISFTASFFVSMPYILYQLWSFVAPGLYQHERRLVVPLLVSSVVLFYFGVAFARFVALPLMFRFIAGLVPADAAMAPDIMLYFDRVIKLLFAFGIAFEVPVATIIIVWAGLTTPEKLQEKRPYIIVGVFVVAMFLTPPDAWSQVLLAVPMWLLFELGVILSRMYSKSEPGQQDEENTIAPFREPDEEGDGPPGAGPASHVAAAGKVSGSAVADGGQSSETDADAHYPEDYKPLTEEELDAELDRFDEEMEALDRLDEEQSDTEQDGPGSAPGSVRAEADESKPDDPQADDSKLEESKPDETKPDEPKT